MLCTERAQVPIQSLHFKFQPDSCRHVTYNASLLQEVCEGHCQTLTFNDKTQFWTFSTKQRLQTKPKKYCTRTLVRSVSMLKFLEQTSEWWLTGWGLAGIIHRVQESVCSISISIFTSNKVDIPIGSKLAATNWRLSAITPASMSHCQPDENLLPLHTV